MARSSTRLILALWFGPALVLSAFPPAFDLSSCLGPPSVAHPFGTDPFGRDILRLTLSASGVSLMFALTCVAFSTALSLSLVALFANPQRNTLGSLNRLIDFVLAFPSLLVSLAVVAYMRPGTESLAIALVIGIFPALTRLLSSRAKELMSEPFVEAAVSLGAPQIHLVRTHLFPHFLPLIWIKFPGMVAGALIAEASLTFLGVGLPKGRESWGSLLLTAKDYMIEAPHIMVFAGVPLVLTIALLQGQRRR